MHQIVAFSEAVESFKALNTKVAAVSTDSHHTHLAFIKTPRRYIWDTVLVAACFFLKILSLRVCEKSIIDDGPTPSVVERPSDR